MTHRSGTRRAFTTMVPGAFLPIRTTKPRSLSPRPYLYMTPAGPRVQPLLSGILEGRSRPFFGISAGKYTQYAPLHIRYTLNIPYSTCRPVSRKRRPDPFAYLSVLTPTLLLAGPFCSPHHPHADPFAHQPILTPSAPIRTPACPRQPVRRPVCRPAPSALATLARGSTITIATVTWEPFLDFLCILHALTHWLCRCRHDIATEGGGMVAWWHDFDRQSVPTKNEEKLFSY